MGTQESALARRATQSNMARRHASRTAKCGGNRMLRINHLLPSYVKSLVCVVGLGAVVGCLSLYYNEAELQGTGRRLMETKPECKGDTILSLVPSEEDYQVWVRALLYLLGMGWFFLGVAISADTFMAAIEVITAKTKTIIVRGEEVEVEVWNGTVANLTLMALGSSAPEILLAVVEICGKTFEAGNLGPGTIVGSASFNLFFIIAICIVSLPPTEEDPSLLESREIEEYGVFIITAIFSLWAYFWMIVVLEYASKDKVEMWEAWVTILMFPLLVGVSYGQDIGWSCSSASVSPEDVKDHSHVTVRDAETHKKRRPSQSVGVDGAEETAEEEEPEKVEVNEETVALKKKKKSRLEYRIQATRKMTGGKRVMPTQGVKKQEEETAGSPEMTVSFGESSYSVLEGCGTCKVKVVRSGIVDQACTVQFDTSDGTALSGNEYVQTMGVLDFEPGMTEREIEIEIIDDNECPPDKNFFVRLFNPVPDTIRLAVATCQIIILNDDDPGVISFDDKTVHAMHTATSVSVPMNRKDGCDGNVLAFVKLLDGTAKAGVDYEALTEDQEEIHFNDQERTKTVDITLKPSETTNKNFTVQINSVEPEGAQIGAIKMCTIIISDDKNYQKLMRRSS